VFRKLDVEVDKGPLILMAKYSTVKLEVKVDPKEPSSMKVRPKLQEKLAWKKLVTGVGKGSEGLYKKGKSTNRNNPILSFQIFLFNSNPECWKARR
jgi:hypothetical protein